MTHEDTPSHNTVVGHSYGTTVVGMSASDGPDRGHLWLLGWNSSAHSAYWKPKNPSLKNIGLIIAGYGGEVS